MNDKDKRKYTCGFAVGFATGALGVGILFSATGPKVEEAKVFVEEGKPTAMRLYRCLGPDQILVKEKHPVVDHDYQRFIPKSRYLRTLPDDQAERALEEARIKKLVEWYKE